MKININAGHNPANMIGCGAVGILNESVENRKVKDAFIGLAKGKHTVYDCTCNNGTSQDNVLYKIVSKCNSHNVDLDLSIHLNSGRADGFGDGITGGVEVIGYNNELKDLGISICDSISNALGIRNRGFKINTGLFYLRSTKNKALLIECCFVDDKDDADRWNTYDCAKAIYDAVTGESSNDEGGLDTMSIKYEAHVQNIGWQGWKADGATAGTEGQGLRLEAIKIDAPCEIRAKAHIQNIGWKDFGVINKNTVIGTEGQGLRLECLCLKGNFKYRVHIQNAGWSTWTDADGIATLGSVGQGLRIEAIEIKGL